MIINYYKNITKILQKYYNTFSYRFASVMEDSVPMVFS